MAESSDNVRHPSSPIPLDALDRRVLEQLQVDASLSNQALARHVHASPPTCLRRVKRLVQAGVIARQVAILAPERLGPSLTAIVEVSLDHQATERLAQFAARAAAEAAVSQCYQVSPGPDFVLVLQLRDMPDYRELAGRLFATDANVRTVRTFFSVHRSKFETRVPLPVER